MVKKDNKQRAEDAKVIPLMICGPSNLGVPTKAGRITAIAYRKDIPINSKKKTVLKRNKMKARAKQMPEKRIFLAIG